ncbi:hypothetical protein ABFX02_10G036100 [Erythranthe guttata]
MPDRKILSSSQSAASAAAALTVSSSMQKLKEHAPKPTQSIGFAAVLTISACVGAIMLLLIAAAVLGPIFLPLLILISNHIWIPLGVLVLIAATGFLSFLGFAIATAAALSWLYRYIRGFLCAPDLDRFDYAATRSGPV